jgi:hypothetical protein
MSAPSKQFPRWLKVDVPLAALTLAVTCVLPFLVSHIPFDGRFDGHTPLPGSRLLAIFMAPMLAALWTRFWIPVLAAALGPWISHGAVNLPLAENVGRVCLELVVCVMIVRLVRDVPILMFFCGLLGFFGGSLLAGWIIFGQWSLAATLQVYAPGIVILTTLGAAGAYLRMSWRRSLQSPMVPAASATTSIPTPAAQE